MGSAANVISDLPLHRRANDPEHPGLSIGQEVRQNLLCPAESRSGQGGHLYLAYQSQKPQFGVFCAAAR